GGVGGNNAVNAKLEHQLRNTLDVLVGQGGGDLDRQRHALAFLVSQSLAAFRQGFQQLAQFVAFLQGPQVLRVRRRNVDGDVVCVRIDGLQAEHVVINGPLDGGVRVFADVQAQDAAPALELAVPDVFDKLLQPFVVEAEPVDD